MLALGEKKRRCGGHAGHSSLRLWRRIPGWVDVFIFNARDLCVDWRARLGDRATGNSREIPAGPSYGDIVSSQWALRGDPRFENR